MKKQGIFIIGSCVTRDAFEIKEADNYIINDYVARSSFGSSFSNQICKDNYSHNLESKFQKNMIQIDFKKLLKKKINNYNDIMIIDFIDERFDLFKFSDGSICTISSELIKSGFNKEKEKGELIKSASEEHFKLWTKGWKEFIESISDKNKIIINKVFYPVRDEEGNNFNLNQIKNSNDYLERLYNVVQNDIPHENIISFSKEFLIGNSNHKWGRSPFHYIDTYYIELIEKIRRFSINKNGNIDEELVIKKKKNNYKFEVISAYEDVKFAFYLYKDNDKVDVKWYSEENFYELVNPQSGEYRVAYFIKKREKMISTGSFDIIKI